MQKIYSIFIISFLAMSQMASAANLFSSKEVVDMSLVDQSVNPCDDFFQYACGNWLKETPIPSDKSTIYRFTEIDENTLVILKTILQNYQSGNNTPAQAESEKLGQVYSACLNTTSNEVSAKKGVTELLQRIHLLQDRKNLMPLIASLHVQGINPFFGVYSMQNPGDATRMIATMDQAGLGLPEKGYYSDAENSKIRDAYKLHIKQSLLLAGIHSEDATVFAQKIFKLETAIAKISLSAQDQQDPIKTYNPIGKIAFEKIAPWLDWNEYFAAIHLEGSDVLNVVSPSYYQKLAVLINKTPMTDLKAYMMWDAIRETSRFSTVALQNEHFNFFGKIMNGTTEREPQWKLCIAAVDNSMGEALGESFIKMAFGQDSKDMADKLVFNVKDSLKEMITNLDWMDAQTKVGALKKIQNLNQKIGFPDHFKSYENLAVGDSWFMNTLAANAFQFDETIKKANLPVDRKQWGMTPPTDNAYYDPTMNEVVFPAGILQAPLFNINSSLAANYGATGATIGHEMTHGFDDSGSQYDEVGNLKNWWTKESADIYQKKSQCLIDQYNSYKTDEGVSLDGKLSLGENIADLGGLKLALAAFYKTNPNAIPEDDMKTFFIAYGQSWCGKMTKEAERATINTDVHSTPKYRVNGVVSNLPEFAKTFQCSEGQAMAPKNRCSVW